MIPVTGKCQCLGEDPSGMSQHGRKVKMKWHCTERTHVQESELRQLILLYNSYSQEN
jgi:hypothetical protein